MSDYSQVTSFGPKDALASGNPAKVIKGVEFDSEFAAISTAVSTKFDSSDVASNAEAAALASDVVLMTPAKLAHMFANATVNLASTFTWNSVAISDVARRSQSNTFTGAQLEIENAAPVLLFDETDAGSNERLWRFVMSGGDLFLGTRTDADGAGANAITIVRTGVTVDSINLQATAVQANGTQVSVVGHTHTKSAITDLETLASGTFTPTATDLSGFDSVTPGVALYMRIGSIVTVSGVATIDPSTTGTVQFNLSLPIASNIGNSNDLAGVGQFASDQGASARVVRVIGDATANAANMRFNSAITAAETLTYTYQYKII